MNTFDTLLKQFVLRGTVSRVEPLGNGLINRTYKVTTMDKRFEDEQLAESNLPSQ